MTDSRTHVLVLFGGRSSEHSISCVSAGSVLRALDPSAYRVTAVGITRSGRWRLSDTDVSALTLSAGSLPEVPDTGVEVLPPVAPGQPFRVGAGAGGWTDMDRVDVVFPVLHGAYGEDGTMQGLLEMAHLPYVGSGVLASAAAMDKGHAKALLAQHGIDVGRWVAFTAGQWAADAASLTARVESELGYPVFVKPCRAGSSVGVIKVKRSADLAEAVARAAEHDPRLIVEASVENAREIECGVLVRPDGRAEVSVCAEIKLTSGHDFYDFQAKYLDNSVELVVPADVSHALREQIVATALRAFAALGCEGLSRVDFLVADDGRAVLNEVNTMPGFTPISMYPRMWQESGLAYPDLVTELVQDALRRGSGLR